MFPCAICDGALASEWLCQSSSHADEEESIAPRSFDVGMCVADVTARGQVKTTVHAIVAPSRARACHRRRPLSSATAGRCDCLPRLIDSGLSDGPVATGRRNRVPALVRAVVAPLNI